LDIGDTWGHGASLFEIRLRLVTKLLNYREHGLVRGRYAVVSAWADGLIKQITNYPYSDRNEARADAERLAEERG
jgi:hypothetical protein